MIMNNNDPKFELSRNIEHYLAILSKVYSQEGSKLKQEIIVNSQIRIHEGWTYDSWDGGSHGHLLFLIIPDSLYIKIVKQKGDLRDQIRADINKVHSYQNEHIAEVIIEPKVAEDHDWRKGSGLLLTGQLVVPPKAEKRIWGEEGFRMFLCHKAEAKKQAADLKEQLCQFGVSSFVAHKDIHPTKEWQAEIENALWSMDALIALMTVGFHESLWTDQEVGFAFGRGVPVVSIKLGRDPYGFIGKFQALSCPWGKVAMEVAKLFVKHDRMLDAYIKAVQKCSSFDQGNLLSEILPSIDKISSQQANDLISAFNENIQVQDSFGFNGKKPRLFGPGLIFHLKRLTGRRYSLSESSKIELKT